MARARLTPVKATGPFPTAGVTATPAATDASNGNVVVMSGKDLVIVENVSTDTAHTVTFASVVDGNGRLGDITAESIPFGVTRIFGPFGKSGWAQSGGDLNINTNHADMHVAVVQIP